MRGAILSLALLGGLAGLASGQEGKGSYLVQHLKGADGKFTTASVPYEPSAGDLMFFDEYKPHWMILYKLVGSDRPHHAALIFRRPNGEFATVEAGPNDTLRCRTLPLLPRLQEFQGTLHIRRVKAPITKEQEATLAKWAHEQDGKRYALGRLALQMTPIRTRQPLRKELFGATFTDRSAYMCAELAVAGGTMVGLFDPAKHKGNTIYPRDILHDDNYDISAKYHEAELWTAYPLRDMTASARR